MPSKRLTLSLLILGIAALLAACTTPTDGLLASQGLGHFNAKSVTIDLGDPPPSLRSAFTTQVVDPTTNARPVSAAGIAQGIGSEVYNVLISATGDPKVTCTNQGGTQAPGQNPAVVVLGDSPVGGDPSNRNGKYVFGVENEIVPADILSANVCPNQNWTARLDFIFWTSVTLSLQNSEGVITDTQNYTCTTTLNSISCTRNR